MRSITTFNFSKYPELQQKYKTYLQKESKFRKAIDSNRDHSSYEQAMIEYMCNDFSPYIYTIFSLIKPELTVRRGNEKGSKKPWDEVFGMPIEKMEKFEMELLRGLIEENYIYRLPDEYYDPSLMFQKI